MKNLTLTIFITAAMIFNINAKAQQINTGDARIITNSPVLQECDEKGAIVAAVQSIPDGAGFNIYGEIGTNYIIALWDWKVDINFRNKAAKGTLSAHDMQTAQFGLETNEQKLMRLNYTQAGKNRYFLMPKGSAEGLSKALYPKWTPTLGTLSYLFKYRPSSGVFESAFNLNVTGGLRVLIDRKNPNHSFAFTGGIGVTTLPKTATGGNSDTISNSVSGGGLTFSGNVIYVWDRLQIGLSSGFDVPVGEGANNWKYRGKPWISFGVGINIFSENKPSQGTSANK